MSRAIQAVIFDKDGTLFDFNRTWGPVTGAMIARECENDRARMEELAAVLKFDLDNDRFHPGSLVIASTADIVEATVLPFTRDGDLTALRARMRAATGGVAQVPVTALDPLFGGLRARGLTLGIVTNDAIAPALANLDSVAVRDHFAFVAGCDSGFGAKPEPGQLLAFCDHTGIAPEACVMVGDSTHDLHAGRAAGMATIGVLTGPALADELRPHADAVLTSIAALPEWLEGRF